MIRPSALRITLIVGAVVPVIACSRLQSYAEAHNYCRPYDYGLPGGWAPPPQPPEVCVTREKVSLGRVLFYDKRLSLNLTQSCSTCHIHQLGFTDGKVRSVGSTGQLHAKNTLGLANVGYTKPLTWNLPDLMRMDNQTLIPFFSANSETTIEELAIAGHEYTIQKRLSDDPSVRTMFEEAFPFEPVIDIIHVARALAAFEATMVSYQSPYDLGTMSPSARRGESLFKSAKAGCFHCHGGRDFNMDGSKGEVSFQNIGLYDVGGAGDYPDQALHGGAAKRQSQGLAAATGKPSDRGKFRTPSLRNAAVTAPYMHDGSVATLEDVVEIFDAGGRNLVHGALPGDGRANRNKDSRIRPLALTAGEKSDLVEFMKALTDECFLTDRRFSDPNLPRPKQPAYCR